MELQLSHATAFPSEIVRAVEEVFDQVYKRGMQYRSTGITLLKLQEDTLEQPDLFGEHVKIEQLSKVYEGVDAVKRKYGKHTLFIGSSFDAHKNAQHEGDRGELALRRKIRMKGETSRRRLGVPMYLGKLVD